LTEAIIVVKLPPVPNPIEETSSRVPISFVE